MLEQEKLCEAKCYLQISSEVALPEDKKDMRNELQAQLQEREKLSEHEMHARIETKLAAIKADISYNEQQALNVRSNKEEKQMIAQHLEILRKQEENLNAWLHAYEERYKVLQEREQQLLQREQLLNEQTQHLEQLLAELISTIVVDTTALQQQISSVVAGDKDVDAARRRFVSLQKAAKDAQQSLIAEERRQRERVEWLQKQMELYRIKGMSPAQLAFRNYLKDVKRLSNVRHQLEHTPFPLRCFISYAWETKAEVNKELQQWLQKLKDELEMSGMEVMLDIRNMKDNMKVFMVQGIEKAHKVLLICTPHLKERAAEAKQNNLQLELETAVEKSKTTPEFIIPLILSGTFSNTLPKQVEDLFSIDFTKREEQMHYYTAVASLAPMGLIPMLLGLENNKDYRRIHDRFLGDLRDY
jgi:hypothetical protein